MDRGTKLMMALWSFFFEYDCASPVQLNVGILLLYSAKMH